jgi:hypothetical protein
MAVAPSSAATGMEEDLATVIQEYIALKNQIKEARVAMKVMCTISSGLIERIGQEMKRRGKTRLEVHSTGDLIVEQSRRVTRKPKVKDMPAIYRDVLGLDQAEKLEAHIQSLVRQEIVVSVTHRKLRSQNESDDDEDPEDDDA